MAYESDPNMAYSIIKNKGKYFLNFQNSQTPVAFKNNFATL